MPLECVHVSPLPTLLIDHDGRVLKANLLAQEFLGVSERGLVGKHLSNLFAPAEAIQRMLDHVFVHHANISDHSLTMRASNQPCSLHVGPDEEGAAAMIVPEANRHEVEQQSRRHEIAEAIARVALEMAHEIKNPLAALRGAAQWLGEHAENDDTKNTVRHILAEVDRIRERIDAFLQLGPRADIQMESVNVHSIIDDVCRPPAGLQLRRVYDPSLPEIRAHPGRLRQAFENLWNNALEAGATMVEWQSRISPTAQLPGHTGRVIEISITNDGAPVPEHIRTRLFEPFVTSKSRGSGLGLALVQRVMLEHGGRVQLRSEPGRTRFTLQFPLEVSPS
jgi:two-component system, NtrC family, nitrogen regulation sensor histidine kinase GlnL